MPSIRPLLFSLTLLLGSGMLMRWQVRRLHPGWLSHRLVAAGLRFQPYLATSFVLLWSLGTMAQLRPLALLGAVLTVLTFIAQLSLVLSLPVAALLRRFLVRLFPSRAEQASTEASPSAVSSALTDAGSAATEAPALVTSMPSHSSEEALTASTGATVAANAGEREKANVFNWSQSDKRGSAPAAHEKTSPAEGLATGITRRRLIELATSAVPVAALASSGSGVVMASQPQAMPVIEMYYDDLPPELEGLKILHISDVHLGMFISVADVAAAVARAEAFKPDLVLLTGDVADDLKLLRPALDEVVKLKPRLGTYAAIGNHEYFRGFEEALRIYDRSPVPLLLEKHTVIPVGNARLSLSGVNDPVHLRGSHVDFMNRTFDATLNSAPSDAFQLVMSHRPEGFVTASARGVHLTLSGHTHGGQMGRRGRSVFEPLSPEGFLWGPYQRGKSRLYTSSGFGHWMPVRVGCPAEAPIIVLRKSQA